jgi:hypothetical protein
MLLWILFKIIKIQSKVFKIKIIREKIILNSIKIKIHWKIKSIQTLIIQREASTACKEAKSKMENKLMIYQLTQVFKNPLKYMKKLWGSLKQT